MKVAVVSPDPNFYAFKLHKDFVKKTVILSARPSNPPARDIYF